MKNPNQHIDEKIRRKEQTLEELLEEAIDLDMMLNAGNMRREEISQEIQKCEYNLRVLRGVRARRDACRTSQIILRGATA